jgi:hypothetical protein
MKAKLLVIFALMMATPLLFSIPKGRALKPGDINGDGHVDILDVVLAGSQFRLNSSDLGYNATIVAKADLAPPYDGVINILDLVTLVYYYGT